MAQTEYIPEISIDVLSGERAGSYVPDDRYWMLRGLARGTPLAECVANREDKANLVVVRVLFRNTSDEPIEFLFRNIAYKAELLSLVVHDEGGAALPPIASLHVRPKPDQCSSETLLPNCTYSYDLVGEVDDGWLVFPGARYPIPQNRSLQIRFDYKGKMSNTVSVRL